MYLFYNKIFCGIQIAKNPNIYITWDFKMTISLSDDINI